MSRRCIKSTEPLAASCRLSAFRSNEPLTPVLLHRQVYLRCIHSLVGIANGCCGSGAPTPEGTAWHQRVTIVKGRPSAVAMGYLAHGEALISLFFHRFRINRNFTYKSTQSLQDFLGSDPFNLAYVETYGQVPTHFFYVFMYKHTGRKNSNHFKLIWVGISTQTSTQSKIVNNPQGTIQHRAETNGQILYQPRMQVRFRWRNLWRAPI